MFLLGVLIVLLLPYAFTLLIALGPSSIPKEPLIYCRSEGGEDKLGGLTKQISFAASEWAGKKKVTRREKFLGEMEVVVPWERLVGLVEKHYPSGKRGRPPIGAERMLRVYFLQQWYGLADEAL